MIKVIRAKDLIKYFIRILIPIIIVMCMFKVVSSFKTSHMENKTQDNEQNEERKSEDDNKDEDKTEPLENDNKEKTEFNKPENKEDSTIANSGENKEEPVITDSEANKGISKNEKQLSKRALIDCIKQSLPQIVLENNEEETKPKKKKYAFLSELELMKNLKEVESEEKPKEDNGENNENINREEVVKARTDVTTEVVPNAVNPRSTNEYNGVKINNSTDYALTEEMLKPDVEINKSKVVIYHTHTCESYTATEQYNYVQSGNFRSTDLNFSVARVGDELEKQLTSYGVQVIHDKTYHDYPAYNGSYGRSLKTAEAIMANNSDADIVIDLHRDAIADETYAPKVKIGDEYASQLMFVMGSNVANPINANWNQNLKFAIKVMQKANELYPGLFKPIILRNSEYNQHVAKGACIIEVGSTGNTLEESMNSMKYLAKILSEI